MRKLLVTIEGKEFLVEVDLLEQIDNRLPVKINGETVFTRIPGLKSPLEEVEWVVIGNRSYEFTVDRDLRWIRSYQGVFPIEIRDREASHPRPPGGDGRIKAPIPGMITKVLVQAGDQVASGQPLLVLEAMKMENEIRSPRQGVVKLINVRPGQGVSLHEVMVEVE